MILPVAVTAMPVLFLVVLFGGGALLRRRNIDMDGTAPISRRIFVASKYLIVLAWAAMALRSWGVGFPAAPAPAPLRWASLVSWFFGFAVLLLGRLRMGESFRIGSPNEGTRLTADGIFRLSRNPMYVGVYSTLVASVLYTLNPLVLAIAAFVIPVHHRIVLAEERFLSKTFGEEYESYRRRVRRYL